MEKVIRNYLILFFLSLVWGSSFILMKKALYSFSYDKVAALRIFIAFISLTPFIYKAIKHVKKKHFIPLIFVGFFGNGFPAFLFAKAQTHLDSSIVGILNSLVPLFTLLFGVCFFSKKLNKINFIGILLGLFGAIFIICFTSNQEIFINKYMVLVVVATIMYAISINIIDTYLLDLNPLYITTLSFLIIVPFSLIYIDFSDVFLISSSEKGVISLLYISVLAVFGTSLAVVIFNQLVKNSNAIFASSVTYLIPIISIFWGIVDGEKIYFTHLIMVIVILSGIYLVNKK